MDTDKNKKFGSYVGAPAIFKLELAVKQLSNAFNNSGVYLVGSALTRPDWRDVDLRMIMDDAEFFAEFPNTHNSWWNSNPKWLLLTISISEYLSKLSGLPVDFQFQPRNYANEHYKDHRHAMGLNITD